MIALSLLTAGFLLVFAMSVIALARVGKMMSATDDLDWEQVAAMTGDIGALKKSIQRLNNRLNGMEARDPAALIQALSQEQLQNVTPMVGNQKRTGG